MNDKSEVIGYARPNDPVPIPARINALLWIAILLFVLCAGTVILIPPHIGGSPTPFSTINVVAIVLGLAGMIFSFCAILGLSRRAYCQGRSSRICAILFAFGNAAYLVSAIIGSL